MNINVITNNQFQVTGLTATTQYWFTINDNPDTSAVQYISGTFTTDGTGASPVIMVENPDMTDWIGEIKIFEDKLLTIEVQNPVGTSEISIVSLLCDIKPLVEGCTPDYVGIQQLKCWKDQFEADINQLITEGKCLKQLNFTPVYKQCKDCETGIAITVIDVCESLKELISAYFLARA